MLKPPSLLYAAARNLAVALVFFVVAVPFTEGTQDARTPLSKSEVVELLKGGVPSGRVTDIVRVRGISFELTGEAEEELRRAGATGPLLTTLRELAPRPTRTVIETSPDALVYCDGIFQGQASSEGRLVMVNLKPGDHSLKISLAGMKDFERPVTVVAGQVATVKATLEESGAAPSSRSLRMITSIRLPDSAAIYVDVDPNTNKVFTSGGASGGQQVAMIDGGTNRVVATLGTGSGAHVNPATGKVYAAGVYSGSIYVYSSVDGHLITTVKAFGCPVETTVDSSRNQVWGGAQCGANNDPVFRIDGSADTLTSGEIGSGGVMSKIMVNPVTHIAYVNAGPGGEGKIAPDGLTRANVPFSAVVSAVNPRNNRLYGAVISGSGVEVIDGNTEAVLSTLPVSSPGPIAVNPTRDRVYVVDNSASPPMLKVFDGSTNALVGSMPLSAGDSSATMAVNSNTGAIYLLISNNSVPSLLVLNDGL